jgi:hypothetical protein
MPQSSMSLQTEWIRRYFTESCTLIYLFTAYLPFWLGKFVLFLSFLYPYVRKWQSLAVYTLFDAILSLISHWKTSHANFKWTNHFFFLCFLSILHIMFHMNSQILQPHKRLLSYQLKKAVASRVSKFILFPAITYICICHSLFLLNFLN